jgi:hypothetical protein
MTDDEIAALPENGGYDTVTDPKTGQTERVRRPVQFLVREGDVLFYTDTTTGERWSVGRDSHGKFWKERVPGGV